MSKKVKKPSVSKLKETLDKLFSRYVRLAAVKWAQGNEYICCCSCGQVGHWKGMHAGHFVTRNNNSTRYDERNVHPQCPQCNLWDGGNPAGYARYLLGKYPQTTIKTLSNGEEVEWTILDELDYVGHQTKRFTVEELQEMIETYKNKLQCLVAPCVNISGKSK